MIPMNRKHRVQPANQKTQVDLKHEWNRIARTRHEQIVSGKDLSYQHILVPLVLGLLEGCDLTRVLDLGCGTGELTKELAKISSEVVGIDPSEQSVEIARKICVDSGNVSFHVTTAEDFAREWTGSRFTIAVANMALMTCLDLSSFIKATSHLLHSNGRFVATITHPWFWPQYWGYDHSDWFRYDQEIVLEAPFTISLEATNQITTHVHRPLFTYINTLSQTGFQIDTLLEPFPGSEIQALYPARWEFPRFLAFRCQHSRRHDPGEVRLDKP